MTGSGVWLGVDPGEVRIGVAISDPQGVLAVPVETINSDKAAIQTLVGLASERDVVLIVVGLPRSLSGEEGSAAQRSRNFATRLASATSIPVCLLDERMTTVSATRQLQEAGRSSRSSRQVVDQVAAVVILQSALDARSAKGTVVGESVPPEAEGQS